MKQLNSKEKKLITIGVVLLLILSAAIIISQCHDGGFSTNKATSPETVATTSESAVASQPDLILEDQIKTVMDEIYVSLKADDRAKAADAIISNYDLLDAYYNTVMKQTTFLYDGAGKMIDMHSANIPDGTYMALAGSDTFFYGSFSGGKPQGECLAICAYEADVKRYDYAFGIWAAGQMSGQGEVGYMLYDTVPEDAAVSLVKAGNYTADLLDGDFTYTVYYPEEEFRYELKADMGKIVLDDGWNYNQDNDAYSHKDMNGTHAYEISKDDSTQVRWNNNLEYK